jgi:hypothetical protein
MEKKYQYSYNSSDSKEGCRMRGQIHGALIIRKKVFFLLLIALLSIPNSTHCKPLDSLYQVFLSNFQIFPEYHTKFDLTTFAFHKSAYFRQQYLAESNTGLEFMFVSFRDLLYSTWDVQFKIGLGDIPGNNVFSVLNIHFFINPTLELRLAKVIINAGYEHLCVHEVDRKNYPVIYYNAPILSVGSSNMRISRYWQNLAERNEWSFVNKLGWRLSYLNFMKDGFGLVDPNKVNGFNPYSHELRLDARYAVYHRRSWIVTVREQIRFGQFDRMEGVVDKGGFYWSQNLGFEVFFRKGKRGAALYCTYNLDDLPMVKGLNGQSLPVFSKDKLLEIGLSFFD